ncbi:MAG: hypothetical protein IBJ02_01070 [Brevundimonas sp.]|nr:hypothetical protein [Brevundimonas sp.]
MRTTILALMLATMTTAPAIAQDAGRAAIAEAAGALLQADGPRARAHLGAAGGADLNPADTAFRTCVLQRLDPAWIPEPPAASEPFAQQALHAYRQYWRAASIAPDRREAEEANLAGRLALLLQRPDVSDMDAAEELTLARIRGEGVHVLGGRTGRLRDLMLWNRQDERDTEVRLPERRQQVRIFLLDDFVSRGWSNWMTCDRTGTGGWVKPEGLYAIVPVYSSLEDEGFAVTFLGHEAQHFADNASWTGMPDWELEFRAKLTEVAMARETRLRVLGRFVQNQGDDPTEPHSYANRRVLSALRDRLGLRAGGDLGAVEPSALRAAAVAELRADTARRPTPLASVD